MIWIGGAPGAGKSTIGRAVAHAYDLPLHPIDRWTYVHAALQPGPPLTEILARGPDAAATAFAESARNRLRLVLADVRDRALGEVPALVEGPQLFPDLAGPLPRGHAVWLLPDPEQTRRARDRRLAAVDDPAGRTRLEALLRRDAVIATRVRDQARAANLPVIEVGADPDWPAVRAAVDESLSPALTSLPRLTAGEELTRQRRYENETAVRQLDLWTAAAGITPSPTFDFACECGRSTCTLTWTGTTDTYRAAAPIQVHH
jgi:hypothetical protein